MGTWGIIAEYYWVFALAILVLKSISALIKLYLAGFVEAFKGSIYTIEIPIIGFLIDANNSWIYLSLCVLVFLEIIGKMKEWRIGSTEKVKVKN